MNVKQVLSQMTLEEKVSLLQGRGWWHTVPVERLGVPSIMVSDGPHGLRKQVPSPDHPGDDTIKATCFPTAAGMACSFDPELMAELGGILGDTCQAEDVAVLLGPAANIKRSPLCGRNFEYFSEDPVLSGEIAAGYIRGVQQKGVGVSLKHFAANNQETRRMSVSEHISQRALREIYLASFERAVKASNPWTLMCSYNKINGTYSSENPWLLTDVLRKQWGWDGVVMSDWGAVNDHVKGVAAGLELEMPRAGDDDDEMLVEAVKSGKIPEAVVDQAAERMLELIDKAVSQRAPETEIDLGQQHHIARKLAREAMVLLKNDGNLLPIRGNKKVAFIGKFAEKPRFQGGGSSHINAAEELSSLEAVRSVCPVTYAPGYGIEKDEIDEALVAEAVKVAQEAEIVVAFLGLPDNFESEGYDRTHLSIPACQLHLLDKLLAVQPNIAVVLMNGAPVEMPFVNRVPAILEAYLAGQAGGGAVVDLIFGAVSPCGKLAETFPLKLSDTPCHLNVPGDGDHVVYAEDIYVGYRYYDKKEMPVLFPFGHGLTYTTFEYSNLRLSGSVFTGEPVTVSVDVTNTGKVVAKEIVQFYVRPDHPGKSRPIRELKAFGKLLLQPGETGTVTVTLDSRAFAYWEDGLEDWHVEPGKYVIEAAASSRDIRLSAEIAAEGKPYCPPITMDSTFGDVMALPAARAAAENLAAQLRGAPVMGGDEISAEMMEAMFRDMPLHAICSFENGKLKRADIAALVKTINEAL